MRPHSERAGRPSGPPGALQVLTFPRWGFFWGLHARSTLRIGPRNDAKIMTATRIRKMQLGVCGNTPGCRNSLLGLEILLPLTLAAQAEKSHTNRMHFECPVCGRFLGLQPRAPAAAESLAPAYCCCIPGCCRRPLKKHAGAQTKL